MFRNFTFHFLLIDPLFLSHIGPLMQQKQRLGGCINHICSYLQKKVPERCLWLKSKCIVDSVSSSPSWLHSPAASCSDSSGISTGRKERRTVVSSGHVLVETANQRVSVYSRNTFLSPRPKSNADVPVVQLVYMCFLFFCCADWRPGEGYAVPRYYPLSSGCSTAEDVLQEIGFVCVCFPVARL